MPCFSAVSLFQQTFTESPVCAKFYVKHIRCKVIYDCPQRTNSLIGKSSIKTQVDIKLFVTLFTILF